MTALIVILVCIIIINGIFAFRFILDAYRHKSELAQEPGNPVTMGFSSLIIFFLSTFGISDFAISTVLYRKLKWVDDKKLPGTLNTQCVLPVAVMALAYISAINVDMLTLILCIVAQVLGAYIGPRFVVRLPVQTIRVFIGVGLVIATLIILAGKLNIIPSGGEAIGLTGGKLVFAVVCMFIFGALNNIGIGSYALTMVTVYGLGLNPAAAFPIMMGACTFSVPVGSMQFIKFGEYARKITLLTSTVGVIGVLCAVFIVKSLNVSMLQWVVALVLAYSGISMLYDSYKSKQASQS
ncbi:sulfite exporter TauE/SafE family protein [Zophobihabitans entericus]|uniref:Probable membrane transporter protein n=1 Tax=Zophobihabitans entericus TaxID=1635327 RepID=A0A6G9IB90_9GAMM|nr:sulfite exporter TauE/SafE family protein [Zophobihabitans entericus]QIQ21092.1 anion permease [Zophobihabitans entericus]